jgi:hypothetical protein
MGEGGSREGRPRPRDGEEIVRVVFRRRCDDPRSSAAPQSPAAAFRAVGSDGL